MTLYKRNASGNPIFWDISILGDAICVKYGVVGKEGHIETIKTHRKVEDEMKSQINAKRKEGYKELRDLYDNAPLVLEGRDLKNYLDIYLPKFNTHADGKFIPMLCKTLEDNRPFEKGSYFGQWKINGERCIVTMSKDDGLFGEYHLNYRSREGVDWTNKLSYLDEFLLPCIPNDIRDLMLEEGAALDGELYLPGYGINEINSFIKNTTVPQHYKLQYWVYDICVESMSAIARQSILEDCFIDHRISFLTKEEHLNNDRRLVSLINYDIRNINDAITWRDHFINIGFEGLVIREESAEYQFGGRRNNSMLKFKKKEDGLFTIVDIVPEGIKRSHLPKFVLRNDINDELFECTLNAPHAEQERIFQEKDKYITGEYFVLVEYRERSGNLQVPFHARGTKLVKKVYN